MPQLKLPKTLGCLALRKCVNLMIRTCRNIEYSFGNYDQIMCQEQVNHLQEYLLTEIPSHVLQEIFDALCDLDVGMYQDVRIVYALFMHKNMKRCDKSLITNSDNFWLSKLPSLNNLVHLSLKLNCTDAILKVVSENCLKLKYINIRSRMEPEKLIMPIGNALKIKYFVSDQGLRYLTMCKDLREIEMNTIIRSNFGGKLTVTGIRFLLKALLNLQSITFMYMGDVLAIGMDDVDKLSLLSVTDFNTQPQHMQAIARTCPDLKILTLKCCTAGSNNHTLNVLANSNLKVTTLELHKFEFGIEMRNLFQAKGCFIAKLILMDTTSISVEDIELVGITCPNIVALHLLYVLHLGLSSNRSTGPALQTLSPTRLFCHLESLKITGDDWAMDLVGVCLAHALNIKDIYLQGCSDSLALKSLDTVFAQITLKNPMVKLQKLCLKTGGPISMHTIEYFVNNCSHLYSFCMNYCELNINEDFLRLQKSIQDRNLDLILGCEN